MPPSEAESHGEKAVHHSPIVHGLPSSLRILATPLARGREESERGEATDTASGSTLRLSFGEGLLSSFFFFFF